MARTFLGQLGGVFHQNSPTSSTASPSDDITSTFDDRGAGGSRSSNNGNIGGNSSSSPRTTPSPAFNPYHRINFPAETPSNNRNGYGNGNDLHERMLPNVGQSNHHQNQQNGEVYAKHQSHQFREPSPYSRPAGMLQPQRPTLSPQQPQQFMLTPTSPQKQNSFDSSGSSNEHLHFQPHYLQRSNHQQHQLSVQQRQLDAQRPRKFSTAEATTTQEASVMESPLPTPTMTTLQQYSSTPQKKSSLTAHNNQNLLPPAATLKHSDSSPSFRGTAQGAKNPSMNSQLSSASDKQQQSGKHTSKQQKAKKSGGLFSFFRSSKTSTPPSTPNAKSDDRKSGTSAASNGVKKQPNHRLMCIHANSIAEDPSADTIKPSGDASMNHGTSLDSVNNSNGHKSSRDQFIQTPYQQEQQQNRRASKTSLSGKAASLLSSHNNASSSTLHNDFKSTPSLAPSSTLALTPAQAAKRPSIGTAFRFGLADRSGGGIFGGGGGSSNNRKMGKKPKRKGAAKAVGRVLGSNDLQNWPIARLLADKLAAWHASVPTDLSRSHKPFLFTAMQQLVDNISVPSHFHLLPMENTTGGSRSSAGGVNTCGILSPSMLEREVQFIQQTVVGDNSAAATTTGPFNCMNVVFCHNQVDAPCIVYDQQTQQVAFLEYEFASWNYQAFDLACFFIVSSKGAWHTPTYAYTDEARTFQTAWLRRYLQRYLECTQLGGEAMSMSQQYSSTQLESWVEAMWRQSTRFVTAADLFWGLMALHAIETSAETADSNTGKKHASKKSGNSEDESSQYWCLAQVCLTRYYKYRDQLMMQV